MHRFMKHAYLYIILTNAFQVSDNRFNHTKLRITSNYSVSIQGQQHRSFIISLYTIREIKIH